MIMRAVEMLNNEQKYICKMHAIEGFTMGEISALMKVPIGTIKSRLHRGRAKLRKILEESLRDDREA